METKGHCTKEELTSTWKVEREEEGGVKEFSARFSEVLSLLKIMKSKEKSV